MKIFLLAALTISSAVAFATPKVGDYAKFQVRTNRGDNSQVSVLTQELTTYNAVTDTFVMHTTFAMQGEEGVTVTDKSFAAANLENDRSIHTYMTECEFQGGKVDTVTSSAGSYDACKMPTTDGAGYYWVANVPLGMAKYVVSGTDAYGAFTQTGILEESRSGK